MKRVELLAPAGGYETMVGAFNAGADAVYLGGSKFGARAYADNFDEQQVVDAIKYAHLHGKKIYMTVNTLVKEREFSEVYSFLEPFANVHLDGVIVQDLGVMKFIRDEFPEVELHASTQQTVTGVYGAKLLKSLGCCRVVPARELSLSEMKAIRTEADIEVEAFIHGAMCYCYSGVCLFSSMVGERSGNRGRCAQPCRLTYQLAGKGKGKDGGEVYPLSLKDMCTIDMIPELIEAGIDSFKIEGRMKRPEYAAGVTALYRKYIDLYYKEPHVQHEVSRDDMEILKGLYLRTGISQGYYHQHNGRNMVTITSPAYNGTSEETLKKVHDKYLGGELKIKCDISAFAAVGEPLTVTMTVKKDGEDIVESVFGKPVQEASKRPMDEASIRQQLDRLGNTPFEAENIYVEISAPAGASGVFVPASELNELRRLLCEKIEKRLLEEDAFDASVQDNEGQKRAEAGNSDKERAIADSSKEHKAVGDFHVLVNTRQQLDAVLGTMDKGCDVSRLYIDSDLFLTLDKSESAFSSVFKGDVDTEVFVALPFMTRREEHDGTKDIEKICGCDEHIDGVLVRNIEQLGLVRELGYQGKIVADYGVYTWNREAAGLLEDIGISEITTPYELTIHEARELVDGVRESHDIPISYNVYGKTPMMVSAGCVKKTLDNCSGKLWQFNREEMTLVDRMGNNLSVTTNCRNCYNVIWNAHPTSLHKKLDNIRNFKAFDHFRIDLTTENERESATVLKAFILGEKESLEVLNNMNYTTGHFKRGVE